MGTLLHSRPSACHLQPIAMRPTLSFLGRHMTRLHGMMLSAARYDVVVNRGRHDEIANQCLLPDAIALESSGRDQQNGYGKVDMHQRSCGSVKKHRKLGVD